MRQETGEELSPSQTAALATIDRHGPLTPSDLAAREHVQRPTATRVLLRLEEAGLVERTADAADARSTLVTTSPKGQELLWALRNRKNAYLARHLEAMDPDERAVLERAAVILERLLEDQET